MKVTIDFEDLFNDYENNETALKQVKDAIEQKAIEYLAFRISLSLQNSIDKSFPLTLKEESNIELSHDDVRKLSDIFVNKYKAIIKEEVKSILQAMHSKDSSCI